MRDERGKGRSQGSKGGGKDHHSFPRFLIGLAYVSLNNAFASHEPVNEFKGGHED